MRSKAWRTPNRLSAGSTGSRAASAFFWAALLAAADATIAGVGAGRGLAGAAAAAGTTEPPDEAEGNAEA